MTSAERMATLAVVDYEALANKDVGEVQKLVQACQTVGMFYLQLQDSRAKEVSEDMLATLETGQAFFKLPHDSEEKTSSVNEGMERGYHNFKGFEYYEIAREDHRNGKLRLPMTFEPEKERIARLMDTFNRIIQTVVVELCAALDIDFPELGDDPAISCDTGFKLVYKAPLEPPGHVMAPWHTDSGLATLLWNDKVMTQLRVGHKEGSQGEDYETVPVVNGAVLVNISDELAARSGGRLHSPVHRVVSPPGSNRVWNGAVYLFRPYNI
ncbi:hypothetical protein PWT90_11178 [Aphanocladium album]|nr:hypothetical protein PWT90_11178 [Aphanocladium album]